MGQQSRGDGDIASKIESHIPLRSVEVDVLIAVADEPTHGYAILKQAEGRHGGHPGFEVPTLYRALRRMREAGLVRSLRDHGDESDDRRRQYWQATPLGRRVLEAEITRLEAVVEAGRRVAGGGASA
jgi:DNA-binding PadR family transcriptional regulator